MCGIIGFIGQRSAVPSLLEGLRRLEYRGYDSAGIAILTDDGRIACRRAQGKLRNLERLLEQDPVNGTVGIGHTRWATHGAPEHRNAHPHSNGGVAVVHNGIIENYAALRDELIAKGYTFQSDTDTEIVVHLIGFLMKDQGLPPIKAAHGALRRLEGAFALALIFDGEHDLMIAARRGSPLTLGYGDGETYVGSDAMALSHLTNKLCYLEDGDWAVIRRDDTDIFTLEGERVDRPVTTSSLSGAVIGKAGYRHYMLKEIYEQPQAISDTLTSFLDPAEGVAAFPRLPCDLAAVTRVVLVACGTSYYAGMVARHWLEAIAHLPVDVEIASEFRYRQPIIPQNALALFISQSGETADTLAALRLCKHKGVTTLALVNAPESSLARESDAVLRTPAGPEIGVASTKAFTTQLTVLACFALACARARATLDKARETILTQALKGVPTRVVEALKLDAHIHSAAESLMNARTALYLGRGPSYPLALEGALKLKELGYMHAEGHAAGEMKHGPIALIDATARVVAITPSDALLQKTLSNVQEATARGARVIAFSDCDGIGRMQDAAIDVIALPKVDPFVAPILYALPVQLLAYHVAVLKGADVDQPRNLAKSVTVE